MNLPTTLVAALFWIGGLVIGFVLGALGMAIRLKQMEATPQVVIVNPNESSMTVDDVMAALRNHPRQEPVQ